MTSARLTDEKFERFLRKAMDRSDEIDTLERKLAQARAERDDWKREHNSLVYVREADLQAIAKRYDPIVQAAGRAWGWLIDPPREFLTDVGDLTVPAILKIADTIREGFDEAARSLPTKRFAPSDAVDPHPKSVEPVMRSAVAAWLRGEEAEEEATRVLFAVPEITDETFGEMARKVCKQLAYMVEYRADFASRDTHPTGGDSTEIEAPASLSGAVGNAETPNTGRGTSHG